MADSTWRPLGELLIERKLIDEYELEYWLTQQKLTGMLLGELLVVNRIVSPVEIAAVLAVQRGAVDVAGGIQDGPRQLGRLLVERELLTESGLQRALLAQRRNGGSLGDILVQRGYVSQQQIDDALTEQRTGETAGSAPAELTETQPDAYEVCAPDATEAPIFVSDSFLDATDFAFDHIAAEDPEALEIVRASDGRREQVWSYSREASERFRAETTGGR